MQPLEPPEAHYVNAAIGWLELGNPAEARAELAHLDPARQTHPDVLEVRWALAAEEENWAEGLEIAGELVQVAPGRASGWLHRAYALRRVPEGGLQQAREALLPAFKEFPEEATIPYNLACYACQLNELQEAREWLKRAVTAGGRERVKQMGLADPDLAPLWPELREL